MVEGKSYPAHSQVVACHSRLIYHLIEDCPAFSRQEPLIISSALEGCKSADVQIFLTHVYNDCALTSIPEALQLLKLADQFDSPILVEKAIVYLEAEGKGLFLQADNGATGILHWLQMAERFNLMGFRQRCINCAATRFKSIRKDPRMLELPAHLSLALMDALQSIIDEKEQLLRSYY